MSKDLRQSILDDVDREVVQVPVPEWKVGNVWVRSLYGNEADRIVKLLEQDQASTNGRVQRDALAGVVVLCLCDSTGQPVFTEQDIPLLMERRFGVLRRIFDAALAVNGISETGQEDIAKN